MPVSTAQTEPRRLGSRHGAALLLVLLCGYGLFSTPGLVRHWGGSIAGVGVLLAYLVLAAGVLGTARRDVAPAAWAAFGLVAVGLRLASAAIAASRVSPGDSHFYLVLAQALLAGRGLLIFESYMGVVCRALYPPLYPIALAGWGALAGFSTLSLLGLSTLIDGAAAWLLFRIGRQLGRARAGRAAAALYLIWPSVLLSAPLAQKESLCALLVLALVHAWIAAIERGAARRVAWDAAMLGIPAALLALTQPGESLLALLFGLALLPIAGWRRIAAIGLPAAGVALLVMLPWWIRNWLVLGAFVPLTTSAGISLWIGNNPEATGNWMPYPPALHGLPEIAFGKAASLIARDWIAHHPLAFVHLTIAKFLRATALGVSGIGRLAAMTPSISAATGALLLPLSQGAHLLMLGGAAVVAGTRRDYATRILVSLVIAGIAQLMLFGMWFEFGERHREFLTPLLLLTVAVGLGRAGCPAGAGPPHGRVRLD